LYFFRTPFFRLIVPTVDTVRYEFIVSTLIKSFNPVLLVGPVGTGKTSVANTTFKIWKGTIQGPFHQSLVQIGPVASEELIKM
jgi:sigma54-dependent transcription regulator